MKQSRDFTLEALDAKPLPVRLAIVVQQVSNYHAARFHAAARVVADLAVVSVLNDADFAEFLADDVCMDVIRVFDGECEYSDAISSGTIQSRVVAALEEIDPDVVAVSGWSFSESLAAIVWARKNGRRVVVMSASQAHDSTRSILREMIKRRVVSACDAALVAAQRHAEYAASLGIPEDAIFFGYDAVDNLYFETGSDAARLDPEARARHGLPERYVLASARFIPKKNLPRLVEAFASALSRVDNGHDLLILGDGPERDAIEAAITAQGVENRVHLPGFRGYELLPSIYGLADGFVHVSLAEQWGLVVNEAAAAALPIVVSEPCGSASTLLTYENGRIVDPQNVDDIAHALAWLMSLSPNDRTAKGIASRCIVADWGPNRFAFGLASAVQAALKKPVRRLTLIDQMIFAHLGRIRISQVA